MEDFIMAEVKKGLLYSASHEWAEINGSKAKIGLDDFSQSELGDIVFITLPDIGAKIEAGKAFTDVESVKAVSEVFSPVSGTVVAVNDALTDNPELINSDPYGAWICEVEVTAKGDLKDADAYEKTLG
jgi:glycine cleavage system H protein